jgi:hypothetical protein
VGSGLRIASVSLDCAEPRILGDFYRQLLGGETLWDTVGSVGISACGVTLIAQRVDFYAPPEWPGASIVHLDLVPENSLAESVQRARELGAMVADFQPDERWRVLLDPAGHPFCITTVS